MSPSALATDFYNASTVLTRRYLLDFPREAARQVERMPADAAGALLESQSDAVRVRVWESLAGDVAATLLATWAPAMSSQVLAEAEPAASVAALTQLDEALRRTLLSGMHPDVAEELSTLAEYPENLAGRLMDPRVAPLRADMTVGEAVQRLKTLRTRGLRELFVVDEEARLIGRVEIQDLAVSEKHIPLVQLMHPPLAVANDLDPREEFVELLQQQPITELPVVNVDGRFIGVIRQAALLAAVEQETSLDVQAMVGASRDERALSLPTFAVKKRLPWLQINLLTAFLAAAVVGMFEGTISKFTALAVLLPVVAGQSGNAGAQALAVTMRALALREITLRHWRRVVVKEAMVGLINGIAVALSAGVGVYIWSRSSGLVLVCVLSMVISMLIAGLAGALVPMLLRRFGQDPALASSIILTTVTDVVGFSSFLGIATLLSSLLLAG